MNRIRTQRRQKSRSNYCSRAARSISISSTRSLWAQCLIILILVLISLFNIVIQRVLFSDQQKQNISGGPSKYQQQAVTVSTSSPCNKSIRVKLEETCSSRHHQQEQHGYPQRYPQGYQHDDGLIHIVMAAVPHTASSTTDRMLKARNISWDTSLPIEERGFTCPPASSSSSSSSSLQKVKLVTLSSQQNKLCHIDIDNQQAHMYSFNNTIYRSFRNMPASNSNATSYSTAIFDCIINKMTYKYKQHSNFDLLRRFGQELIFTTLRQPQQTLLSHYRERADWDWTYDALYHSNVNHTKNKSVMDIGVEEWIQKAWYRHNLFVKLLSTDTQLIFRSSEVDSIYPSKIESDNENSMGENSVWLSIAMKRLAAMPFFGLFHRLSESLELFGFHLCIPALPAHAARNETKRDRVGSDELDEIVRKHFTLDTMLLERAEPLFDALIADMRRKKEQGLLCDLGKVIEHVHDKSRSGSSSINIDQDWGFGLMCINEE